MQARNGDRPRLRFATAAGLEAFGAKVAARLQAGEAVCLFGPLGAGKTTFSRGLIRARMGLDTEVPSPTFTLVQSYEAPGLTLAHFDLYRLKRPEEAYEAGLDEALDVGAVLVEWSERLEGDLPPDRLEVELAIAQTPRGEAREAAWRGFGRWERKAHDLGG